MAVRFLTAHTLGSLYNQGEVAGFDDDTEADLIKRGIAELAKGKPSPGVALTAKKVGEGWSVFAGKDELVKGLADKNAAQAWIAEQAIKPSPPVAKQVGETWSVFSGDDALVEDLADEAAAQAWIADRPQA